ncbi:MAG: 1-deoxy-D-xylulose-5-phosphate synthase [Erysipelotrichaceae bacterium]|nr:1-deoxy-D-xylulose-5-phosphate synthase [Erysipelotrichaceae bacterium]
MKKEEKHIDLKAIDNPDFLKDLSYRDLDVLSSDITNYLVDVTSKTGGHLSSNLGVVDATLALCRSFDFKKDKIIFDVGHQSYTYKLLTGRDLTKLRQKDGISGFQKVNESPYDHFECGHSSTSISVALGMATARDLKGDDYSVISFIGDSSIVNGLAFEGLNTCQDNKHKIIIVLNDNEMSISRPVGGISHLLRRFQFSKLYAKSKNLFIRISSKGKVGIKIYNFFYKLKNAIKRRFLTMTIFDNLGFSVVGPIDGHDIKGMEKAFAKAKRNSKSTIVIIKTIKGKGYKYCEEDKEGKWHGVAPFDKETGQPLKKPGVSWSEYFSSLIDKKMMNDKDVVTITPATGYGSELLYLEKAYPTRVIDVGIAEEHALTYAGGLSISGIHPIICIYSTFLQRAYDELSHDIARMKLDATILVDRAGLVGNDGETHQGIYDEAFLYSIPNVTISMPSNTLDANYLFDQSFEKHGPFVVRFPREEIKQNELIYPFKYGRAIKLKEGKKLAVVSLGPIIHEVLDRVEKEGLDITIYNSLFIKPIDLEMVKELLNYDKVIIYDVYGTKEGLAIHLIEALNNLSYKGVIKTLCVPDKFIKQATIKEQREDLHISLDDLFMEINK